MSDAGDRLLERVRPYAENDPDGLLVALLEALASTYARPNEVLRDDDIGSGLRRLMDPARCPEWAIPWLAQFAGTVIPAGTSTADARLLIADNPYRRRGTPGSIAAAIRPLLTGDQQVFITERVGDADHLTVSTLTAETPDAAKVLSVLQSPTVKPVGLLVSHATIVGGTYGDLLALHSDYADVLATFSTYADVLADPTTT